MQEFSFYHNTSDFDSYTVEEYKLDKINDTFYLSLDPDMTANKALSSDGDIIRFKDIQTSSSIRVLEVT